ncbi:MAG: phosphomannomutase/phosphoglucomutase [Bacteroidetes bacterium HGW-Bacteroidetes-4]|jgi:phosphomannomutase|nr:MAG: phosphomannomutase/phosphoglucomutase [Bacteroidetes bacterium HGW-Bacteroidetes-4]
MGAFHAYDIRGIYNKDFNKDDVYKIGFFIPELLKTDKVLVGRDVRVSSPEIFEYLCNGITDAGADVHSIGLATTPMVYWSTAKYGFTASVQITASHNTKEYNGLKVSREKALPVGYDTGLGTIEKWMKERTIVPVEKKGKVIDVEVKNAYLNFQKKYLSDFSNLSLAVDCSNGMAGLLIKDLLGDSPVYLYEDLDGTFPNHEANPLIEENVADLKAAVLKNNSDIGVIFDGDADRVMFVDEKGKFISPDLIIGLMAHYFLEEKGLKGNVLQDIRTSKAVAEYIQAFGSTMHMWRVGRAFAALKLREIDGIFGGELAGHYYFRDFYYSDSGLLAMLIVLEIVSKQKAKGKTLSQLIDGIRKYANSGEINFKIEKKKEAMDAVRNHFMETEKATASFDFDGYRVEFADWWFNIRPSNTEPYLRLLAEAKTDALLNEKIEKIKEIIHRFE